MLGTFLIIFGVKRFVFGIKFILLDAFLSIVQCLFCCILCLIIKFSSSFPRAVFFLGTSSKTRETRKWPRAWLKARDGRGSLLANSYWLIFTPLTCKVKTAFAVLTISTFAEREVIYSYGLPFFLIMSWSLQKSSYFLLMSVEMNFSFPFDRLLQTRNEYASTGILTLYVSVCK